MSAVTDPETVAREMAAQMVAALRDMHRHTLADDGASVLAYVRDCTDPEAIDVERARFVAADWAHDYAALCDEDPNAGCALTGRELGVVR